MQKNLSAIVTVVILALLALLTSAYTVDQRQSAIKFRLGEVVAINKEPGLYFRIPMLENIKLYDTRIQTLDTKDAERIQTMEKNNVLVDSFVKYRIADVKQFYVSTGGDLNKAEIRLAQSVNNDLRDEFSKRTLSEVISGERNKIMEDLRVKSDADARSIGIEVLDVRLKRVDLAQEINADVYKRMESERKRVANELRSTGEGEKEKIKADADRQHKIILAEAYRDAQKIMGEGDAAATKLYAQAYSRDPEFFAFYRRMDVYKNSLRNKSDVMVLDANAEFFKYMKGPNKAGK